VLLLCAVCALALVLRELGGAEGARLAASSLLALGAAVVVAHLVDLVLPRPQVAYGVPRGLLGLVAAVLAAAAVTWLRRRPEDLFDTLGAAIYGGVVGAVAVLVSLAASYVVVQAHRSVPGPRGSARWALPVIQALLPVAACAPLALALAYQTTL
jgi:ABC-type Mn2+/Zn2+ transport system permease subunit